MHVLAVSHLSDSETIAIAFNRKDVERLAYVFGLESGIHYDHTFRQEYNKLFNDQFVEKLVQLRKAFNSKNALKKSLEDFQSKLSFLTES